MYGVTVEYLGFSFEEYDDEYSKDLIYQFAIVRIKMAYCFIKIFHRENNSNKK